MFVNDTEIPVANHKLIYTKLKFQGRTIHWLADNLNYCYQHTYRLVNGKEVLTEKAFKKMIELLETNY